MPSTPPGFGIPGGPPVDFGQFGLLWTIVAVVLLVASASALWLLRSRPSRSLRLTCPHQGTTALVSLQRDANGAARIVHCSLCHPPGRVDCDRRCLRQVA